MTRPTFTLTKLLVCVAIHATLFAHMPKGPRNHGPQFRPPPCDHVFHIHGEKMGPTKAAIS